MRLDRTIVEKIRTGDALYYDELKAALKFYTDLEKALDSLGPEFRLAWKEVMHIAERLRMFSQARKEKI